MVTMTKGDFMKQILIVLALVLSAAASADSVLLFETRYDSATDYLPEFQINKDLGRAWVNVVEAEWNGDSSNYTDNRVKVEGLSYRAEDKKIVLERDGQEIVCAEIYNRRFILDGGRSIRLTDRCSFSQKKVKVQVDNGYEIRTKTMMQVYLNVE
jgi:hypothetical protein